MKRIINLMCIIGIAIFMAAALTLETHMVTSLVWGLIGFVLIVPQLRVTYLAER